MSGERFDILFGGELVAGHARASVADNLARLFKATPETVARLLDGGTHTLKRDVDRDTAMKYLGTMERAGARAVMRAVAGPPGPAPVAGLALAPTGTAVLAEHERRVQPAREVDTSHIRLASAFASTEPAQQPLPPAPDTSHLSVAPPGAGLLAGQPGQTPPPPPDTSAITLAAAGATLGPERLPDAAPVHDTSHIALAPPGTPLEELRPERRALAPDTSALALAPLA